MCGYIYVERGAKHRELYDKLMQIRHRGPDNLACKILPGSDEGLGHVRLRIVDQAVGSDQPMCNDQYKLLYNGEIYNYKSIRAGMTREGVEFSTNSDTEVLFKSLIHYGVKSTLAKVKGMYSFVFINQDDVFICRDEYGIKPVFYGWSEDHGLVVSTNSKSVSHLIGAAGRLRHEKLSQYFQYRCILPPDTIFEGVYSLPQHNYGHWDKAEASGLGSLKLQPMASMEKPKVSGRYRSTFEGSVASLDAILREVVAEQHQASVPVAYLLSGGIDSSLLVAISSDLGLCPSPITFKRSSSDPDYNSAKAVANHLGLDLVEVEDDGREDLTKWFSKSDQPTGCSSGMTSFLVFAKLRRLGFKVAITGDGADEMFGGYKWLYKYLLSQDMLAWYSENRKTDALKVVIKQIFRGFKAANYAAERYGLFKSDEIIRLVGQLDSDRFCSKQMTLREALESDLRDFLPLSLQRTDAASMAVSVEARVPYLDQRVVDFAKSLPDKFLIENGVQKRVLRKLGEKYLPSDVLERPKIGFTADLSYFGGIGAKDQVIARLANWIVHNGLSIENSELLGYGQTKS